MCREEQTLAVAVNFSLNTFQLQVQPFGLTGDQFGTGTILGVTMGLLSRKWLSRVLRLE
jgi:galactitol-specific phosphotransferase system IIC component